jgi:hypothetical protein
VGWEKTRVLGASLEGEGGEFGGFREGDEKQRKSSRMVRLFTKYYWSSGTAGRGCPAMDVVHQEPGTLLGVVWRVGDTVHLHLVHTVRTGKLVVKQAYGPTPPW